MHMWAELQNDLSGEKIPGWILPSVLAWRVLEEGEANSDSLSLLCRGCLAVAGRLQLPLLRCNKPFNPEQLASRPTLRD